ncbi:hypothetical protein HDE_03815 [Halotydeus destructor]|nr:hypothetical protein HDE_03815 [Halotydeus destructor]
MNKLLLAAILALTVVSCQAARARAPKGDCQAQIIKSDKCAQIFMFIREPYEYTLPRNSAELQAKFCSTVNDQVSCLREYRPCLKSFARTLYDIITRNVRVFLKDTCKSEAKRTIMTDNLRCWSEEDRVTFSKKQSDSMAALISYAASKPQNDIIEYTCCSYHYGLEKMKVLYKQICNEKNLGHLGDDNYFLTMIKAIMGDAIDLICAGSFANLDKCKAERPAVMADIVRFDGEQTKPLNHSVLVSAVTLLQAIERDHTIS